MTVSHQESIPAVEEAMRMRTAERGTDAICPTHTVWAKPLLTAALVGVWMH